MIFFCVTRHIMSKISHQCFGWGFPYPQSTADIITKVRSDRLYVLHKLFSGTNPDYLLARAIQFICIYREELMKWEADKLWGEVSTNLVEKAAKARMSDQPRLSARWSRRGSLELVEKLADRIKGKTSVSCWWPISIFRNGRSLWVWLSWRFLPVKREFFCP